MSTVNVILGVVVGGGILLIIAGVLFYGIHLKKMIRRYGPASHLGGEPCARGYLTCVSVDAPTLGGTLTFEYELNLFTDKLAVTGKCRYPAEHNKKTIYYGEVLLLCQKNRVKGRSSLNDSTAIVEGSISPSKVRLTRGYPPESFLKFFNGPYQFSLRQGQIHFDKTAGAQGKISADSDLRVENGRLVGRVFHAPQRTWAVDVDVTYRDIRDELAALAVILVCDDILNFHHD